MVDVFMFDYRSKFAHAPRHVTVASFELVLMDVRTERNYPIKICQSWGVASARNTSSCNVPSKISHPVSSSEYWFDVPIGPSVIRWDVRSQSRLLQFQAHSDLITCMRLSPDERCVFQMIQ